MDYINYIKGIEMLKQNISVEEKLYILLKQKIEYYVTDISKRKFILRYHMFPPEEISNIIREKYKGFTNEENKIILYIIGQSDDNNIFKNNNIDDYLLQYRRFENHLVYEMIVSSIKFNDKVISNLWTTFWNDITL